jgi:hypothetical protein
MLRIALLVSIAVVALGPGHAQASFTLASRLPVLARGAGGPLGDIQWVEQTYTASTGETLDVSVSPSYAADEAIGQRWADFFASLLHGPELRLLKAYVASLPEVRAICGGGAVGCYGDGQLIVTNEPAFGFSPEEVARHEYGHHIALNRSNSPWPAFDWGPKRWATAARICQRVRRNDAYPGDESLLYKLNPGEGFAEAYRVLVDTRLAEAHPAWPLVDPSFYPISPRSRPSSRTSSRPGPAPRRMSSTRGVRSGCVESRRRSTERSPYAWPGRPGSRSSARTGRRCGRRAGVR